MRENRPSLGHPLGKSKGYGFLSFKSHDDALNCLRKVNNNPKAFGKNNVSTQVPVRTESIWDLLLTFHFSLPLVAPHRDRLYRLVLKIELYTISK